MGTTSLELQIKFESAKQRCQALLGQTAKLEIQQFASPGAEVVRDFVAKASGALLQLLDQEASDPDLALLEPRDQETRVHRACKLVPFLYETLGVLIGAEIDLTPGELVLPLRRSLRKVLPGAEVLLRSGPDLNYSIEEIADDIRQFLSETPLAGASTALPEALYVISLPTVEADQVLLHAILAHEAGHGIYEQNDLADKILPKIEIPREDIATMAKAVTAESRIQQEQKPSTIPMLFQEIGFRDLLTQMVTGTISSWVAELACDVLGVIIFGPAYLFAFVHLFPTLAMLDEGSETHPPPRLRLRLMCQCLRKKFSLDGKASALADFINAWELVANQEIGQGPVQFNLALKSVSAAILDAILDVAAAPVPADTGYSNEQFTRDISQILPLLEQNVPAAEPHPRGTSAPPPPDMAQLLNAGWFLLLTRFEAFRANLPASVGADLTASRKQLHKLLLKSFELAEIKRRSDDVRCGNRAEE